MKRAAIYLLSVILAGCAGQRPNPPPSAAVVPPNGWRGGGDSIANTPGTTWWRGFGDPVLTGLVERALANNVDIAMATDRVEEGRAEFALVRGQLLPRAEFGAGVKRERYLNDLGIPVSDLASGAQVSVSYDLDLFGRLRNATEASRASLLATEAARDGVILAVTSSAASGYIGLRTLDARLAVVRETVSERQESLKIARRLAQAGYATRLEVEQAEAELHGTEQLVPSLELAIRLQENALSVILGDDPHEIERGAALSAMASPPLPSLLPSQLLRRRPDIAQAERSIVAADRSLDAARAAFMPDLLLGASGGYVNSSLIPDPVAVFSLGASILAPLYEGGRLHAQADAAAARRDEAAFAYRRTALNAFREVENALAAVQRTAEREQILRQQRDSLAQALEQATKRYLAGYSSYIDQLDAQRGLLSAELSVVQASGDHLAAVVNLFQALGGGWEASPVLALSLEPSARVALK